MRLIRTHVEGWFSNLFNIGTNNSSDNVELSTWTFDDMMNFIGAEDYAVAA